MQYKREIVLRLIYLSRNEWSRNRSLHAFHELGVSGTWHFYWRLSAFRFQRCERMSHEWSKIIVYICRYIDYWWYAGVLPRQGFYTKDLNSGKNGYLRIFFSVPNSSFFIHWPMGSLIDFINDCTKNLFILF